ncbi:fatty acid synthase alpha subunit FasA [Aspergillus ochraceoroseus]|uniref:Fatty acid synthase alpha subunit FasA n=1 Tax=Aspergillus ochraceoroseus TaxID=138278 RepID=A0A0F8UYE0_9EURO|nr:fatty acid synthase alpha subunit FasA [Aspergillus ochraceoroseus]
MRPEIEQELAHTLLVELLAYQFASPVRWIETQDVILAEKRTERIVEIGPADTLGGMAKRTLASKYEAYDAATSVQRQILCYNKDAKEIYYDVDPVEEEPELPPSLLPLLHRLPLLLLPPLPLPLPLRPLVLDLPLLLTTLKSQLWIF